MSDDNVTTLNQPYDIDFQKRGGLVPVILQDEDSGKIIEVAYVNNDAFRKTIQEKQPICYCYDVSGEKVVTVEDFVIDEVRVDCDQDALLYLGMSKLNRLDFQPLQQSDHINFCQEGLVLTIAQEDGTGDVLMLGYANAEALEKSMNVGKAMFWNRLKGEVLPKGETSGDFLEIKSISRDPHGSVILYEVGMAGTGSCHTKDSAGNTRKSCFYRRIFGKQMQFLPGQK